eukprot:c11712_g1_i1.p1 GENE.c11712_g1_i1~~c11712_g1_i1.p1  ORF type:complete len:374 (-),score=63.57 c11712_g1_i1:278-1399(-)
MRSAALKHFKVPWTKAEDEKLKVLVEDQGPTRWHIMATQFENRTGRQCRARWMNHISPGVKKAKWTKEEDAHIMQGVDIHGAKWSLIARDLPGRTDAGVKNRYFSFVRKGLAAKPRSWTATQVPMSSHQKSLTNNNNKSDDDDDDVDVDDDVVEDDYVVEEEQDASKSHSFTSSSSTSPASFHDEDQKSKIKFPKAISSPRSGKSAPISKQSSPKTPPKVASHSFSVDSSSNCRIQLLTSPLCSSSSNPTRIHSSSGRLPPSPTFVLLSQPQPQTMSFSSAQAIAPPRLQPTLSSATPNHQAASLSRRIFEDAPLLSRSNSFLSSSTEQLFQFGREADMSMTKTWSQNQFSLQSSKPNPPRLPSLHDALAMLI